MSPNGPNHNSWLAAYDDYPARVEYTPTEYCFTITDVLESMKKWGKEDKERIKLE